MYSRLLIYPKQKSFFLFGPRGTGKSTWVKTTFPDAVYLDLLESDLYADLLARPARLQEYVPAERDRWIVIDEVQRVPAVLNEVHRLIEDYRVRFILTGSSARSLRKRGVNLLAGRALTCTMHPLTRRELGSDFVLSRFLDHGGLPGVTQEPFPQAYLESYVRTYLREEVQQEGLTRNLGAFSRFLEAASFSQGSVLNVSAVSRECAVERKVVEHYFGILDDLLLSYRLPVFTKRAKRRMVRHRKFYFFDAGVYRTLRPKGPLDRPGEIGGAGLETLFLQELVAYNAYLNLGYSLFYWRTGTGLEVDFVLYGERGIKAFEVKLASHVRKEDTAGLAAFLADYPMADAYLIYCGTRAMRDHGVEIVPIETCLAGLPELLAGAQ